MGTKQFSESSSEEFRLRFTPGSLAPCWEPVLQIRCEPRIFKHRKSKQSPIKQRKILPMLKGDIKVYEVLSKVALLHFNWLKENYNAF